MVGSEGDDSGEERRPLLPMGFERAGFGGVVLEAFGAAGQQGVKPCGQGSGIEVLQDDGVLGVEGAGLGEEGVGGSGLTEETGFAGLQNQLGDAMLAGDVEGHGVVGAAGVELVGFGKLGSAPARSLRSRRRAPSR